MKPNIDHGENVRSLIASQCFAFQELVSVVAHHRDLFHMNAELRKKDCLEFSDLDRVTQELVESHDETLSEMLKDVHELIEKYGTILDARDGMPEEVYASTKYAFEAYGRYLKGKYPRKSEEDVQDG